jgi:hypothetical protein
MPSVFVMRPAVAASPLVQIATISRATASTATATFPAATTAGNLLVAAVGGRNWNGPATMPAGWVQVGTHLRDAGDAAMEMWIYPNAAATSSVAITVANFGTLDVTIAEFSGMAASLTGTVGTTRTGSTPNGTVLTAAGAAPGDGLAVLMWSCRYGQALTTSGTIHATNVADVDPAGSNNLASFGFEQILSGTTFSTTVDPNTVLTGNVFLTAYIT